MKQTKLENTKLVEVKEALNGEYYVSRRGVPLIIVKRPEGDYSVCYFKKRDVYKIFNEFCGSGDQGKVTVTSPRSVIAFFSMIDHAFNESSV